MNLILKHYLTLSSLVSSTSEAIRRGSRNLHVLVIEGPPGLLIKALSSGRP